MLIDEYITLNNKLGHQILRTDSISWIIREDKTSVSCPQEISIFPSKDNIKRLLKQGIIVISFRTDLSEKNYFEYIFQGTSYDLNDFDRKTRNRIKKGLNSCQVKSAALTDLLSEGLNINQQTTDRQEREESMLTNKLQWEKYISTLYNEEDVHIKGAYVDNLLIAYAIFIKIENKYYIYHPYMKREYSSFCPMNAIYFSFINEILMSEDDIQISAGLSSYIDKKDLDRFKTNMRFEKIPCSRVLVVSSKIAPFINSLGYWFIQQAEKIKIVNPRFLGQYEILLKNKHLFKLYLRERPLH